MPRRLLGAALTVLLALGIVTGAVLTGLGFLDGHAFPGELLSLFRLQLFLLGVALAAVAALARRRRLALVALGLAGVNALGLVPAVTAASRPDPERPQLRLLLANVSYRNDDYAALVERVARERPDVVGLTELTPAWAAGVDAGLEAYPHRLLHPQPGAYGIGLYSRVPLEDDRLVYPAGAWPAVARGTLTTPGGPVELFVLHGPSARSRTGAARQRAFVRRLGALAREAGDAALVCGDLNATPWNRPYQELRDRGGLEGDDPWRPFEWTYPVGRRLLRVPIDGCLAGRALSVSTRAGPEIGSDHLPLLAEVARSGS
jgi:endonuclease/exonuclease/phosphatase (EEP) superfamily protein YafD